MRVTPDIIPKIMSSSYKVPVFVICYSPHCGHCLVVLPHWEKLKEKYKDDKNIIIADTDCVAHRDTCHNAFNVYSYPSFRIVRRGKIEEHKPKSRDFEGFDQSASDIKQRNLDELCQKLSEIPTNIRYPYFILHTNMNQSKACRFVEMLEQFKEIKGVENSLYTDINSSKNYMEAVLGPNLTVNMKKHVSYNNAVEFISEYKYPNFEETVWTVALSRSRPVAVFIEHSISYAQKYKEIAEFSAKYFWFIVTSKAYNERCPPGLNITDNELPAVWFSNSWKNKGYLLKNATLDKMKTIIESDISKLDGYQKFKFKKVFSYPRRKLTTGEIIVFSTIGMAVITIISASIFIYLEFRKLAKIE